MTGLKDLVKKLNSRIESLEKEKSWKVEANPGYGKETKSGLIDMPIIKAMEG